MLLDKQQVTVMGLLIEQFEPGFNPSRVLLDLDLYFILPCVYFSFL